MNLQQLQTALKNERSSDRLQSISSTFYTDAETYIKSLRDDRKTAAEDAPNIFDSREVMNLSHKIQRAEETLEKTYNRRIGKIINQAVLAASGGSFDKDPLTESEQTLYTAIIDAVNNNRTDTLAVLSDSSNTGNMFPANRDSTNTVSDLTSDTSTPTKNTDETTSEYMSGGTTETDTPSETTPQSPSTDTQSGGFAANVEFGDDTEQTTDTDSHTPSTDNDTPPTPPQPPQTDSDTPKSNNSDDFTTDFQTTPDTHQPDTHSETTHSERTDGGTTTDTDTHPNGEISRITIQITQDIGEIYGIDDRTYELTTEDVVSLPKENAKPLLENNAAITLE